MPSLLANIVRGEVVESQHFGHVAVVDADGKLVLGYGDPQFVTYIRSAAKPFQALPLYEDAVPEIFGLDDAEMAVVMSSHNGEDQHVAAVESILRKAGGEQAQLQCGVHAPLGLSLAGLKTLARKKPTVLHNNCSGKHAGMLAACINRGWPTENYLDVDHPHQKRLLRTVAWWAETMPESIPFGIDGCSAPNFALSIYSMARMYASLIASHEEIPRRIVLTCVKHPEMIAGTNRFDTEIMRITRGKIMAKTGAEGIECLAIDGPQPLGMAVKVMDGSTRAIPPIVIEVLEKLQALSETELEELADFRKIVLHNHRGLEVGRIEPAL